MDRQVEEGASAPREATSLAEAYRQKTRKTVTLPSGAQVVVKRGSLMDFLHSGSLPAPMLAAIEKKMDPREASDPENRRRKIEGIDHVIVYMVESPKIVMYGINDDGTYGYPALKSDELGVWEMTDNDKLALFNVLLEDVGMGQEEVDSKSGLPQEPAGGNGPLLGGEGIRPAAERPSGPEPGSDAPTGEPVAV